MIRQGLGILYILGMLVLGASEIHKKDLADKADLGIIGERLTSVYVIEVVVKIDSRGR